MLNLLSKMADFYIRAGAYAYSSCADNMEEIKFVHGFNGIAQHIRSYLLQYNIRIAGNATVKIDCTQEKQILLHELREIVEELERNKDLYFAFTLKRLEGELK